MTQNPSIAITKDPATQTILSGGTATWNIVVTNTGDVPLTNVNVSDPLAADCVKLFVGTLAPGASEALYTCTKASVTADFTNVATAHGTPPVGGEVTDSDSAAVDVISPLIVIIKGPNDQQVLPGGTATFSITVTNSGDVALTNVTVTDAQAPGCANSAIGTLAAGASTTYTCTLTNVTVDFTNTACVVGTPPLGPDVTDCDDANVDVIHPAITITKDPPTQTVASGGTATWTIVVTNTGDVALTSVNVTDPLAADCVKTFGGSLAPGASEAAYTCTKTNVTANFTNVATAHGTPAVGPEVTANDSADVVVPTGTGAILPTNTECSDFVNNTTPALAQINYTVSGGKIGQNINPGVFFYYTYVTTTIPNEAITTSQHAGNSAPLFQTEPGSCLGLHGELHPGEEGGPARRGDDRRDHHRGPGDLRPSDPVLDQVDRRPDRADGVPDHLSLRHQRHRQRFGPIGPQAVAASPGSTASAGLQKRRAGPPRAGSFHSVRCARLSAPPSPGSR